MNRPVLDRFESSDAAAEAAAALIAGRLAPPGKKALVVTGGSGPGPVYDRISKIDLGWDQVTVTLSDDRWVEPDSPLSNERLVRERLLVGAAGAASFVPLKGDGASPEADAATAEPAIASLMPFDAVLLGMGSDGHIASLFQGHLDPDEERLCIGVATAGLEPYVPRISLTVRALLDTALIVLLVGGQAKLALLERVLADRRSSLPVAAVLRQDRAPVRILWSP